MNRDIAANADKAAALKRKNARLRLDVARLASSERIQEAAAEQGLVLPAPGEVRYLRARPGVDPRRAAKTATAPEPYYVPPAPVTTVPEPTTAYTDPATVVPPETTYTDPAAPAPATTDPTATDPALTGTTGTTGTTIDPATGAPVG
jgi:hypothetical protein